jgi:hypothetical protein
MTKKYRTSTLIRIFTLGIKQYGYKIDRRTLTVIGLVYKHIPIDSIDTISFELRSNTYFYIITSRQGKEFKLAYSILEGATYQDMFREILKINSRIKLTDDIKMFLDSVISHKTLKFDFNVYKGEFFTRDQELSQEHPSLDFFIGITIVTIFFAIPLLYEADTG